jgi:RNA polymerase-binding transcription factor
MNATELERYKRLLLAKRDELIPVTQDQAAAPVPAPADTAGDLIDRASAEAETELQLRLRETDGRVLKAIAGALERIVAGTFGICEDCRQPIARARLDAVPWTRLCRQCKERRQPAA